jgi:endonuclease YncB( thermonuclease family)
MRRARDAAMPVASGHPGAATRQEHFLFQCAAWSVACTLWCGGGAFADTRCAPQAVGGGIVASVTDGRSFRLADGREVRLAGIEVPLMARAGGPSSAPANAARAALETLVAGREVMLKASVRETDRYGRLVAQVFLSHAVTGDTHIQHLLLEQGQARVSTGAGACRSEFLLRERQARTARRGVWTDKALGVQDASLPSQIAAQRGHFAVVEGEVLSVRSSGATIYLNFGRRWIEGFAVTIRKRDERIFAAAGLTPKSLEGKRVRVRGVVDERTGPRIEALLPEQIEVVN